MLAPLARGLEGEEGGNLLLISRSESRGHGIPCRSSMKVRREKKKRLPPSAVPAGRNNDLVLDVRKKKTYG